MRFVNSKEWAKTPAIGHNEDSDEQINEIAVSAEANCRPRENRSRECNRRHGNRSESECSAREHPGAKTCDHELATIGGVGEESHRNDRPGGPKNECISHQPMHGLSGDELRLPNSS